MFEPVSLKKNSINLIISDIENNSDLGDIVARQNADEDYLIKGSFELPSVREKSEFNEEQKKIFQSNIPIAGIVSDGKKYIAQVINPYENFAKIDLKVVLPVYKKVQDIFKKYEIKRSFLVRLFGIR